MDKTCLIVGGSRGIGKATAERFLKYGGKVGISYNNTQPDWIESYPEEQRWAGQLDVTNGEQIPDFLSKYKEFSGKKIDVFIYNTGITIDSLTIHGKNEEFDKVLSTNLRGAYIFMTKKLLYSSQISGRLK